MVPLSRVTRGTSHVHHVKRAQPLQGQDVVGAHIHAEDGHHILIKKGVRNLIMYNSTSAFLILQIA